MARRVKAGVCSECGAEVRLLESEIFKLAGRLARKAKKTETGAPKVMKPCIYCKVPFSSTEMRLHVPRCKNRPNKTAGRAIDPNLDQKFAAMVKSNPNVIVKGTTVTPKKRF